jgi:hypothetical protein
MGGMTVGAFDSGSILNEEVIFIPSRNTCDRMRCNRQPETKNFVMKFRTPRNRTHENLYLIFLTCGFLFCDIFSYLMIS